MATNSTTKYHFPLFVGTDKPSVLTDWNNTMQELDEILSDQAGEIEATSQIARNFNDQVLALRHSLEELVERVAGDESEIGRLSGAISSLRLLVASADQASKDALLLASSLRNVVGTTPLPDTITNMLQDYDDVKTTAENAGTDASKALQTSYDVRLFSSEGIANQIFLPALTVAKGDYVYGHRVNEETHDDQPVEGGLYRATQTHSGQWNSAHFERVRGKLSDIQASQDKTDEIYTKADMTFVDGSSSLEGYMKELPCYMSVAPDARGFRSLYIQTNDLGDKPAVFVPRTIKVSGNDQTMFDPETNTRRILRAEGNGKTFWLNDPLVEVASIRHVVKPITRSDRVGDIPNYFIKQSGVSTLREVYVHNWDDHTAYELTYEVDGIELYLNRYNNESIAGFDFFLDPGYFSVTSNNTHVFIFGDLYVKE